MQLTPYHAKYLAHELTQRYASKLTQAGFTDADNLDKITASLSDAQVDLNPHQVDAALFAMRSPLSNGVILADEVGLGKTIEAGIVIAQRWAERKRRILIICPANLRKQWSQELSDKFFLPSTILEKKSFDETLRTQKNLNPFDQSGKIILCSFQFARAKDVYVERTQWDLVVIDEAHRLRNVYRKDNKIGNAIKDALAGKPKVLLTATPLQNSILELFGLVSLVDDYIFGDIRSFRQQYGKLLEEPQFNELKERISHVCKRTLRAQVREYVRYTERICHTQEFQSNDDEHELYERVSEYLRKPKLHALPAGQRSLMTLILRKLLASSTFAIADTLKGLLLKLEAIIERQKQLAEADGLPIWEQDFEAAGELKEEWNDDPDFDDEGTEEKAERLLTSEELEQIKLEAEEVAEFHALAMNIRRNSKGEHLITALAEGFKRMSDLGAARKAVIFTESVRTQRYIKEILEASGFGGKIVLFNGSNNDPESTKIYQDWLQKNKGSERVSGTRAADIRAALTDTFKDESEILIATEAAAEGINLQFCSMVINFDMPWNPQRIEQRIGRCHRYGQKHNVVVINFLNTRNAADVRVYDLLRQKFNLFEGVFGASDEILGTIESGVDFEKRIIEIYQSCRTETEIQAAFDALQNELNESIKERLDFTHQQLLENFDQEVLEKIKTQSEHRLDAFENKFWEFSRYALEGLAENFDDQNHSFKLVHSPQPQITTGNYRFLSHRLPHDRHPKDAQMYRIGHPLARHLLDLTKEQSLPQAHISFQVSEAMPRIAALEEWIGTSGWLTLHKLTISTLDTEDVLLFSAITEDGVHLDDDQCKKLFSAAGKAIELKVESIPPHEEIFAADLQSKTEKIMQERNTLDVQLFNLEMEKLDFWANDKRVALHSELKAVEQEIRLSKNNLRQLVTLADRVKEQRRIKDLEKKLADARFNLHAAEDEIEKQKELKLSEVEKKLEQEITSAHLFTIQWSIV
jgi:ERCC4-related helicase